MSDIPFEDEHTPFRYRETGDAFCRLCGYGWPCKAVPRSHVLHVIPRNDLTEHEEGDACTCGPRVEPVKRDDGSVGWIIVHHSLDGREATE